MLSKIIKDGTELPRNQKIIKAVDYSALADANAIIEQARERARQIIADAETTFAEEKERGYRKGLEQGVQESAQQMLRVSEQTVRYLSSVEQQMTELLLNSVRKVVGEFDDKDLATRLARQALSAMRGEQKVTLRLNADDITTVEKTIRAEFPDIEFLELVADERLSPDQCVLESELGVIDASIETQLEALRRVINARFSRVANDSV